MGNFTHLKFFTSGLLNARARYISHVHATVQGIVTEKDRGDPRADANNIIINLDNNISIN